MTYAPLVYPGDGVTTDFAVTWNYLSPADVKVAVAGVDASFTFLSANLIKVLPAPTGIVKITRQTASEARSVIFPNVASLTATQLNKSADQLFYLAEEANAVANEALFLDAEDAFNAGGKRITNIADPTEANDAATLGFIESRFASDIAQVAADRAAAGTSASNASTSATNSANSAGASQASRVAADADAVATAADRVQTGLDRAAVAADKSTVATDKGLVAADKATVIADKGIVAADKAIVLGYKGDVAADRAVVAADKATVNTDKGIVAADKATVATDKGLTSGYKDAAAASAAAAAASAGTVSPAIDQIAAATDTLGIADTDEIVYRRPTGNILFRKTVTNLKAFFNAYYARIGASNTFTAAQAIVMSSGWAQYALSKSASGQAAAIIGKTNNVNRWGLLVGNTTAETGSNVGSDFIVERYDDAGNWIDVTFGLFRSGATVFGTSIATAANYLSGTAQKLMTVANVWAAAVPVDLGSAMSGNVAMNFANGINYFGTLAAAITFNSQTGGKHGQSGVITLTNPGGAYTVSVNTSVFKTHNAAGISLGAGENKLGYYVDRDGKVFLYIAGKAVA